MLTDELLQKIIEAVRVRQSFKSKNLDLKRFVAGYIKRDHKEFSEMLIKK